MRTLILIALLGASAQAWAGASPRRLYDPEVKKPILLAQTPPPSTQDEEDDEEEGSAPATPAPTPSTDAPAANAPSTNNVPVESPGGVNTTTEEQQRLVNGAPLNNPNVAVHTVEKKSFSDEGRAEFVLFPVAAQLNGKFTQHFGSAASFIYHLNENFGLHVSPIFNWSTEESAFNKELVDKVKEQAQPATSMLLVWGAYGGVEVTPFYGKFAFYNGTLAHFSFVLNGGAGVGGTKAQLKPYSPATGPATYGGTGLKFLGEVGGGFRLQIGSMFTVRLEVRDLVYTARMDTINGCNAAEIGALNADPNAAVGRRCNVSDFGADASEIQLNTNLARNLVSSPSSDVLNNVGFYTGLGIVF
jgi:outer membrane beta-barrel protein